VVEAFKISVERTATEEREMQQADPARGQFDAAAQLLSLVIVAAIVLGFGIWGYAQYLPEATGWDVVFHTLNLFALSFRHVEGLVVPWPLEVARFLVHILAGYAIALAVYALARRQLERRRAIGWDGHVVVVGSGHVARQLARNYRRDVTRKVVMVGSPGLDGQEDLRQQGVLVVTTEDVKTLQTIAADAARVIIVGEDDSETVELATRLRGSEKVSSCGHFLVNSPYLAELLRSSLDGPFVASVDVCCIAERVAGRVLQEFPPRHDDIVAAPPVVVGCGAVAQELVRRMVRGWYQPADPVRVMILQMPEEEYHALEAELGSVGELHHERVDPNELAVVQAVRRHAVSSRPTAEERERRTERGPLVLIAGLADADTFTLAQRLVGQVEGARVVGLVEHKEIWDELVSAREWPKLCQAGMWVTEPRVLEADRTQLLAEELFNDQRYWRDDVPSIFGSEARGTTSFDKLPPERREGFLTVAAAVPAAAHDAGLELARDNAVPLVLLPEELALLVAALRRAAGVGDDADEYLWYEFAAQLPALTARAGIDLRRTADPHVRFGAEQIEAIAREAHEAYRRAHAETSKPTDSTASQDEWSELSEFLKESNRGQARDIPAKLAAIGRTLCRLEGGSPNVTWLEDDAVRTRLARWEHRRWEHLHRRAGYVYGAPTDHSLRHHEHLRPWEELDGVKQLDHRSVLAIPTMLATVGLDTRPLVAEL
jgi:hypothetical protein